jgi:hypothetical protein
MNDFLLLAKDLLKLLSSFKQDVWLRLGESMKKVSSSFLLLIFAILLVSLQSYAQISVGIGRGHQARGQGQRPDYGSNNQSQPQSEIIREQVHLTLRPYERVSLSTLLRLSYGQENSLEVISLSIRAQSLMNGLSQLDLIQNGRPVSSQTVRHQMNEIVLRVPMRAVLQGLELSSISQIYIESITAQVRPSYGPSPDQVPGEETQVQPHQLISLSVNQDIRDRGHIDLERLANQQMGLTLVGAQIDRLVVQGRPVFSGRAVSVQVELNRRPVGEIKYLSTTQNQLPLQVQSIEEVRSLGLIVNGDAEIREIRIRVGQVRPHYPQRPQWPQGPQTPSSQRIYVQQEISSRYPLSLSSLLPYENRLIRSVTIEARSILGGISQLTLSRLYGGHQGIVMVGQFSTRSTIGLPRAMMASELELITDSLVLVESIEIEFDQDFR